MDKSLTSKFFKGNRDRLLNATKSKIVIVTANGLIQKSSDESFPLYQDTSFWYLTGINEADLILVKTASEEFIIVPKHYVRRQSVIEPLDKAVLTKASGIEQILNEKEGWQKLKLILKSKQTYATLAPNPVLLPHHGIYTNPARRRLVERVRRLHPKIKVEDIRKQVARQRMVKQPVEIDLLQKAVDITTDTLKEVLAKDNLAKYKDTDQIEKDILAGFLARGGSGHAFDPVISNGVNTALIHYDKRPVTLKPGDLVVCDVGSSYSFYKADITRTVIYGQPSKRQQDVYEAVRYVQNEAYKLIKPGMEHKTYEARVTEMIGEQLRKLGLIKTLNKKDIRKYYMTYCSHSLGLDTHDSADYAMKFPENVVMTVEPGIYIKEEAIGVRIEDVIQITIDGCKLLSSGLPIGLNL